MVQKDIINFIGIKHDYRTYNCITILIKFYKEAFGLDISGILPTIEIKSRRWMKTLSLKEIDILASKYAKEISFTNLKDYDILVFKDNKNNYPIHFAMYIAPNRIFHLEEGRLSTIDYLSDYWVENFYKAYRHEKL